MVVAINKMKTYYLSKINTDDITVVEMVDRYLEMLEVYRQAQKQVKKDGPSIEIINASQSYIKSHPLISDMKNLNAQLLNLKRDIDKHIVEYTKQLQELENAGELL